MDEKHYQRFVALAADGLRKEAEKSLREFLLSFTNDTEREEWVWRFLDSLNYDAQIRIRHELFAELIFPILCKGYQNNDFECMLWLGKLIQDVYRDQTLHRTLNHTTDLALFKKCYEIRSGNDEVRRLLLEKIVEFLRYSMHEWPSGILFGTDGATLDQCAEIRQDVSLARKLDDENKYNEILNQFSTRLTEYEERLNS